jgi:hypothetical protein
MGSAETVCDSPRTDSKFVGGHGWTVTTVSDSAPAALNTAAAASSEMPVKHLETLLFGRYMNDTSLPRVDDEYMTSTVTFRQQRHPGYCRHPFWLERAGMRIKYVDKMLLQSTLQLLY